MNTTQQQHAYAQTQRDHVATIFRSLDQPADGEDAVIERSWRRCIDRYGLNPTSPSPPLYVPDRTLREHQDQADALIHVARAGLEQLYRQVTPLDYVVLLTDAQGIAVQFLGPSSAQREHQRSGLYVGVDWSEENAGTCAAGTCIQEQIPLTCHHSDHFSAHHISLTCTAAPVFDPDGQLLAVLNISAYRSPESKASQTFALQMVKHYAQMIEDAYFLQRYSGYHIVCLDRSREFVQTNRRYLIAIEEDGTLVAANTAGRKLLRHHELPLAGEARPFRAWHIQDLLDAEVEDVLNIRRYCDDRVRAFLTHRHRELHFATLIEPQRRRGTTGEPCRQDSSLAPLEALADGDPAMRDTLTRAARLRNEAINILVIGETGTGKELMARALHNSSRRRDKPFVAINCAAMPESLIESELFGYEPGSFTGANSKGRKGMIAQADGGTLFLDEIGDMPLQLQTRLLRVLAEQEVLPINANQPVKVDLRVVAATHRDLRGLIELGGFREDLFYRLNGASLRLPSLRERADKGYLIRRLFEELHAERGESWTRLGGDAMSALLAYPWPGNIRELHNVLRYALATCEGNEVVVGDLPEECTNGHLAHPTARLSTSLDELAAGHPAVGQGEEPLHEALRQHRWNISAVARQFGLSRPTIYRRMKRLGIVPPHQQYAL